MRYRPNLYEMGAFIVDDCSTDNTEEVVASFKDTRIKYFKNEKTAVQH